MGWNLRVVLGCLVLSVLFAGVGVAGEKTPCWALPRLGDSAISTRTRARKPNPEHTAWLRAHLSERPFHIPAPKAKYLAEALGITPDELLIDLMPIAKEYALPELSEYLVGEAGRGASGDVYLGVNVEFPVQALSFTVHGEGFLISQMLLHGEKGADTLALPAPPCGYCRQFLWELHQAESLKIVIPEEPYLRLFELFPMPFGPEHLNVSASLLAHSPSDLELPLDVRNRFPLANLALMAAKKAYAPYYAPTGVAVHVDTGEIFQGVGIENAAHNPSLLAIQVALTSLVQAGISFNRIKTVVLVEREGAKSEKEVTRAFLHTLSPKAKFQRFLAKPK